MRMAGDVGVGGDRLVGERAGNGLGARNKSCPTLYRTLAHGSACGNRGEFSRALAYSPVRMAGQTACPEEWLARAGKSVERARLICGAQFTAVDR